MTIFNRVTRPNSLNRVWRRFHPSRWQLPGRSFCSLDYGALETVACWNFEACLHGCRKALKPLPLSSRTPTLEQEGSAFRQGCQKKADSSRRKHAVRNDSIVEVPSFPHPLRSGSTSRRLCPCRCHLCDVRQWLCASMDECSIGNWRPLLLSLVQSLKRRRAGRCCQRWEAEARACHSPLERIRALDQDCLMRHSVRQRNLRQIPLRV